MNKHGGQPIVSGGVESQRAQGPSPQVSSLNASIGQFTQRFDVGPAPGRPADPKARICRLNCWTKFVDSFQE